MNASRKIESERNAFNRYKYLLNAVSYVFLSCQNPTAVYLIKKYNEICTKIMKAY